jgi:hypothetical protein
MQAGQKSLRRPSKNKELRLGTWNVLSLYRSGSLKQLIDITQRHKIYILAVQEMRWVGQSILEKKMYHILQLPPRPTSIWNRIHNK